MRKKSNGSCSLLFSIELENIGDKTLVRIRELLMYKIPERLLCKETLEICVCSQAVIVYDIMMK